MHDHQEVFLSKGHTKSCGCPSDIENEYPFTSVV